MLNEGLAALAASAGTGLVAAMVTDGWQQVRVRAARLLSRGDAEEGRRQEDRLEQTRREVVGASADRIEEVARRQGEAWRIRFEDLLGDHPEAEAAVRELVAHLGAVQVDARAFDHAQQAVQGQGVQHNTFGSPPVS